MNDHAFTSWLQQGEQTRRMSVLIVSFDLIWRSHQVQKVLSSAGAGR